MTCAQGRADHAEQQVVLPASAGAQRSLSVSLLLFQPSIGGGVSSFLFYCWGSHVVSEQWHFS